MSIKIFNGYRAKGYTVDQLYPHILSASVYVRSFLERSMLNAAIGIQKKKPAWYFDSVLSYLKDNKEISGNYFDSSLCLFPHNGSTLILIHGGECIETLYCSKLPMLEEYGFWTNTDDRPYGVSAEQWEERRNTWLSLMPDYLKNNALLLQNDFDDVSMAISFLNDADKEKILSRHFPEVDR